MPHVIPTKTHSYFVYSSVKYNQLRVLQGKGQFLVLKDPEDQHGNPIPTTYPLPVPVNEVCQATRSKLAVMCQTIGQITVQRWLKLSKAFTSGA